MQFEQLHKVENKRFVIPNYSQGTVPHFHDQDFSSCHCSTINRSDPYLHSYLVNSDSQSPI